jgi:YD repeat-containing protein
MTSIALPAGYDPGRLPGYLLGGGYWLNWYDGGQPAGVPGSCGPAQCPPDPAPWTPEPGAVPEGGGGARGGGATAALRRAGALLGIAQQVGVTLPAITAPEGCAGGGACAGWLNLDGSLAMQVSAGGTREPFAPPICLTLHNLDPSDTPREFGSWQASVNPKIQPGDGNVAVKDPLGTSWEYQGSPANGQYYAAPVGAQNRLKKISGGYEEYQVNGLKRTYEDTDGLLTGWTGQAGTWTVNRVNTRIESIVDPAGWRTTLIYDEEEYPTTPRLSEIIDSAGRQTLFEYDASGNRRRLLKVTSPEQCVTSFSYYGDDRLQAWTTPSGLTTTFS